MQKNDNDLLRWCDIHAAIMEYYAETTVSKYGTSEEKNAARFAVEGTLYAVEDVEPVQTWIPVTERLPEADGKRTTYGRAYAHSRRRRNDYVLESDKNLRKLCLWREAYL